MGASGAVQTSVTVNPPLGRAGQQYDNGPDNVQVTKIATEAIPFGSWVSFTAEGICENPDSAAEITNIHGGGIALIDPTKPSQVGYEIGDSVRVLVKGRVWVPTEEAVANTDTPFARHTAGGGGSVKGVFRNDADTASAATPANTRFYQGGTSLAVLELT